MAIANWMIGGVLVLNLVLGGALVLALYASIERQGQLGELGAGIGVVAGAALIYAEATLGERMLQPTVGEMKLLVLAAAFGAVVGVVGTVVTVKPKT